MGFTSRQPKKNHLAFQFLYEKREGSDAFKSQRLLSGKDPSFVKFVQQLPPAIPLAVVSTFDEKLSSNPRHNAAQSHARLPCPRPSPGR